jgi:hypothetical protein
MIVVYFTFDVFCFGDQLLIGDETYVWAPLDDQAQINYLYQAIVSRVAQSVQCLAMGWTTGLSRFDSRQIYCNVYHSVSSATVFS